MNAKGRANRGSSPSYHPLPASCFSSGREDQSGMNDWITIVNFSMDTVALTLMIIGILSVGIDHSLDYWSRRFFAVFFAILFLYTSCNYLYTLWQMLPESGFTLPQKPLLFFESLLSALLIPLLTVYLLRCAGEPYRKSRTFILILALFLLYFVLLTITQFTRLIYYYTPDGVYHRGPWYPLLLVPSVMSMATLLIAVLRRRRKLSGRQFLAFLIYTVVPMLGMLIQMRFYGLNAIVFGTTIASMFMYIFIMLDQAEKLVRRQEEIARQRASIMVLQMRPHFIYNTLISIYYLCEQDVKKAQQVILDFSSYLRQNFTAIVKEDTVPFSQELEHTRAYLAVEQVRFEDKLFVIFDTPLTGFRLPPLTLQPVVENAVKHGVDPELGPLKIMVQTIERDSACLIIVSDNGPGCTPTDDTQPHIALDNIRERLELMCGGTLDIQPGAEGGTVVTITIPEKRQNH